MHKLMEFVCDELEELDRKVSKDGKLSRTDLEDVKDLTEVKKNILKIKMLSDESEYSNGYDNAGYSRRGGYSGRMSYSDGGSYGSMSSYAEGNSYTGDGSRDFIRPDGSYRYETPEAASFARGRRGNVRRDAMGRYSRAEDEMTEGLMKLMEKAPDEQTRNEIRKLMDRM